MYLLFYVFTLFPYRIKMFFRNKKLHHFEKQYELIQKKFERNEEL
ncbi:hypothetical protein CN676_13715 [Bacillus wiedmannii]|uniref:Uncharacterized protein n=1 Tax=Bacillus wiedmannii TaxID=1890302 RepID=A0A0G8C118_9BACI|nr:hypothetical protein B4147_2270 [Bacillus wiedmannii]PEA77178.1 hypothetical protein CON92_16145 [Bacillus wiedmannii]PEG09878.1 hypothetical protein CON96_13565 [Bacillus wiedmannii]PEJ51577.1 hypothetical protein CN676_13715 [Bacillus wiedmannii]PEL42892.1 hypothetical protein CN607_07140 [Bacillus wiedmannii]